MAQATRTLNPLPFQDLEPRRFEDLVRQLAYDFKPWRRLEATGRSGGDGSFDARGYEIVPGAGRETTERDDENDDTEVAVVQSDRLWLIQCKRERAIGPAKLKQYLDEIPVETRSELHGIVFAAACDFSKATRDTLRDWAREHGINEAHMWGKGELEDQLYQPKNDHLLFAYFGFSLQIRKQSVRTALRSRLAMKKRAETVFNGTMHHSNVLVRDPAEDRYPYADDPTNAYRGIWRVYGFRGLGPLGIYVQTKRHFAYFDDKSPGWDIIEAVNVELNRHEDHWALDEEPDAQELYSRALDAWYKVPEGNRANYYEDGLIRYEEIYAIDATGDELASFPHIYIDLGVSRPLRHRIEPSVRYFRQAFSPDPKDRVKYFPDPLPPLPSPTIPPAGGTDSGEDERLRRAP